MRIRSNVTQIFARKFPGVVLIHTSGHDCPYGYCTISFQGTAQELLRHGLIDADMIPPGRKRCAYSGAWYSEDSRRRGSWSIDRERGGILVVWRDLSRVAPTRPLSALVTLGRRRRALAADREAEAHELYLITKRLTFQDVLEHTDQAYRMVHAVARVTDALLEAR